MRILIVTDAWHPQVNGVVRTLEAVAEKLRLRGHEARFITPQGRRTVPLPSYREIGLTLTLYAVLSGLVQAGLVGRIVNAVGERASVVAGLVFGAVGFAAIALSPTGFFLLIFLPIGVLWGLAGPANQSIMTSRVEPTEQGLLQGALASLTGIAGMIGPGLFTTVFALFIGRESHLHQPGAPFMAAAVLVTASVIVAFFATREPHTAP